ncbi:MAG TPA: hypothetical protein VGJ05_12260 [Fimbriiglobus sp.]|jgi:hypothetical protein
MSVRTWFISGFAVGIVAAAGCGGSSSTAPSAPPPTKPSAAAEPPAKDGDADIKANLAKLSPEDRKIAEAQKVCPMTGDKLGEMGTPIKLTLKGQTVFVCCNSCVKGAEKDPDATLKKLAEAKAKDGKK